MMRFGFVILLLWFGAFPYTQAAAQKPDIAKRYASIIVDFDSLEIIHARQIDDIRYPASLTKIMTLYLTFEALNARTLTLNQKIDVSTYAAQTPPSKLGLRAGQTITVSEAIQALTVRSANDAAVVLAEAISGTEEAFAQLMTQKAQALQMLNTRFKTSHGLPNPQHVTTARDMAKLASAILNHHRAYYLYFGQKNFSYKGRTYKNTNNLLHKMSEIDGFKTGYTNASGHNLVISAQKDGRRLIAIILGSPTAQSRDNHMIDLIERGFSALKDKPPLVLSAHQGRDSPASQISYKIANIAPHNRSVIATTYAPTQYTPKRALHLRGSHNHPLTLIDEGDVNDGSVDQRTVTNPSIAQAKPNTAWSIQVGVFSTLSAAQAHLSTLSAFSARNDWQNPLAGLAQATTDIHPLLTDENQPLYRTRFSQLAFAQAKKICHTLQQMSVACFVINPN